MGDQKEKMKLLFDVLSDALCHLKRNGFEVAHIGRLEKEQGIVAKEKLDWSIDIDDNGREVGSCPKCGSKNVWRELSRVPYLYESRMECEDCGLVGEWERGL